MESFRDRMYQSARYEVWKEGEYSYRMALRFRPNLVSYLHPESAEVSERPCMIVVPGGGYEMVSPSEGEIVAARFYDMGYNCFVFTYTCNFLRNEPLHDRAEQDLSRAIRYVRAHAEEFRIDAGRVVVTGFSAGGHLCGCLAVHASAVQDPDPVLAAVSNRPDAAVLSYPVISSDPAVAHQGSFDALLGPAPKGAAESAAAAAAKKPVDRAGTTGRGPDLRAAVAAKDPAAARYWEELDFYSLEKHVTKDASPVFLWHTVTDELVPVDNSLRLAAAYRAQGAPFALHLFSQGNHGLSLANRQWANGELGEPYCCEQAFALVGSWQRGEIPDNRRDENDLRAWVYLLEHGAEGMPVFGEENPEVQGWPELAQAFLQTVL